MNPQFLLSTSLAAALASAAAPAFAQAVDHDDAADVYHTHDDRDIVVTGAVQVSRKDVLSGVAVLRGEELTAALRSSIGDTLAHTPGVSASSFGPSASRPVLRGLQGERVRVLSNGIGSIDVSNTSADHASAINPLLARRIEVLRGPQSLQYGSAAIGGVVNVIDHRIPVAVPDEPVHLSMLGSYGSAADERSLSGSTDVALGGGWVAHFDGSYFKSNDLRIGGYALTPALRAEALASSLLPHDDEDHGHEDEEIDFAANAGVKGRLPNSAARTWTAGAGLAYINDGGSIGVAYSRYDSRYGIPIRLATLPGQHQEAPVLHLKQDRIDARAEVLVKDDLLDRIAFRYAYGNYSHAEIDPEGAIGTSFFNKGMEGRLELVQADRAGWTGASGAQFVLRDFNVVGDEAYLPRNDTRQVGLFTVQQLQRGPVRLEAGLRFEHSRLEAKPLPDQAQFTPTVRTYDAFSGSVGAAYDFAPGWKIGANLSRAERAPSAEELFANGPHHGTETYEIGNLALRKERATSVEAILRGSGNGFDIEASIYHSWFGNFIYEARTGGMEDGLPVYQISQADAKLYGFEVQGEVTLAKPGTWTIKADALADWVHAEITGQGPAPRIPPLRLLGGLSAHSPKLDLRAEVEHVTQQDRVAAFETTTPGYTSVNAEIALRPWGKERPLSFTLSANNLFNVTARRHASFLKDYAPLAGRDIRVTARLEI
ncbi:TonB-dependent receptor [Novosphingobium sp.]|uniref:TonB-dependent receptor n=1 Tax=Novosphingobium sp. TaxID=1874826 RepID=UPI002734731B|nr:TonB-dependent receptor [Novosphingobium sp.]MDP3906081.1 TonB-dependent receptor [Novosphingobium sp.]